MGLRVSHISTKAMKTYKVVIVFAKYKNLVPWKFFPDHDILPSNWHHVLPDASFHRVCRTLSCWEFLNDKTYRMKKSSICKDSFSSFQHITFLTSPFSQIKANSENFNLSIEMPSKFIKSQFPSKLQFCSVHEIMMKICVETF